MSQCFVCTSKGVEGFVVVGNYRFYFCPTCFMDGRIAIGMRQAARHIKIIDAQAAGESPGGRVL